ncbi:hypothetical protein BDN67DRAFT_695487 [Paxillus ammoniavirescens]|nr:hypothetical protein BDN67DRAFT_695487 [Paxillus ammoniavirescens]
MTGSSGNFWPSQPSFPSYRSSYLSRIQAAALRSHRQIFTSYLSTRLHAAPNNGIHFADIALISWHRVLGGPTKQTLSLGRRRVTIDLCEQSPRHRRPHRRSLWLLLRATRKVGDFSIKSASLTVIRVSSYCDVHRVRLRTEIP